jgi:ABC-2 type transport system permease protein
MTFMNIMTEQVRMQELNYPMSNITLLIFGGARGLFATVQGYVYLYIPLLTMSLMSREISSGSINLLYSSPVSNRQIIFGKYLSMMIYGLAMIAVLVIFVVWGAFTVNDFDFPIALSGLLGLYLLICAYAAIGLFMSSLTSYQVVAAIGTLAVLAVLNLIGSLWQEYDFIRELSYWLSIGGRAFESFNGLICSEDILYFIIVSGLFLALSIMRMKFIRQKSRWQISLSKYAGVFVIALTLGYFSSRPKMMFFFDVTETKQNTLTKNSQDIIRQVEGGLTMTTYVNVLDRLLYNGLPANRKRDISYFTQYIRFKPELKMKYVYYYNNAADIYSLHYPGLTDAQIVGQICKTINVDSTLFISPEEINKTIDLSPEQYRLVRLLERDNGKKTFLRMFDDFIVYPGETEISAAFKRLVMDLPVIGFLTGHGERGYNDNGDRGYFRFSQDKPFRHSLINQGFDCAEVRLDKEIPADINILVIADMRSALTLEEQARLDAYIARGGNLVIAGETNRQEVMNPLTEQFGVRFLPGQLVKWEDKSKQKEDPWAIVTDLPADFIQSQVTEEGAKLSYIHEGMRTADNVFAMPGCVALEYSTGRGYKVIPLCASDSTGSWNEQETTNFIDDTVKINPEKGEIERSYPTALALTREIAGKEQKIVILGDADCLSNSEISKQRHGVRAANFSLIIANFFWMSDNEVPIDVRRPAPSDNSLSMTGDEVKTSKWFLNGILPLLMLITYLVLWLRRRGR